MSISISLPTRCSRGGGTSNCPSAARSTSASAKATITRHDCFFDLSQTAARHFVADAGDDRVGRWLDEKIDLARVYPEIWKDAAPAHLVDIAVLCDSDDTHTASISYFGPYNITRYSVSGSRTSSFLASTEVCP